MDAIGHCQCKSANLVFQPPTLKFCYNRNSSHPHLPIAPDPLDSSPLALITYGETAIEDGFRTGTDQPSRINTSTHEHNDYSDGSFPAVTLDTTLSDLYALDQPLRPGPGGIIQTGAADSVPVPVPVLVNAFPSSDHAMTPYMPCNTKFLYQDSEAHKPWSSASDEARLQKILAVKLLGVLGQRYTFAAGKMRVVLFDPECDSAGVHALKQARETTGVFPESQQPEISVFRGLADVKPGLEKLEKDAVIAESMPFDLLENLPHVLDPEMHYALLSKGLLAVSELPTPASEAIDIKYSERLLLIAENYGAFHPEHIDKLSVSERHAFDSHVSKCHTLIADRIRCRSLPFVVKLQHTSSGGGTFIIRTERERYTVIYNLRTHILPRLLSCITRRNAHLKPASVILLEYIEAVHSYGLTFFVTRGGTGVFLGCARQQFDKEGYWTGGMITYSMQRELEERYGEVMDAVAKFMSGKGYYGPVGVDLLEDKDGGMFVVDINARVPGSLPLGVLKGHFYDRRGLDEGFILLGIKFGCSRHGFLDKFRREIDEGCIVVVAWYEEVGGDASWANLAMAGKDSVNLQNLIAAVKVFSIDAYE